MWDTNPKSAAPAQPLGGLGPELCGFVSKKELQQMEASLLGSLFPNHKFKCESFEYRQTPRLRVPSGPKHRAGKHQWRLPLPSV